MNTSLIVQEIGIAVVVRNHNPAIFTYDFLKYSGIIRDDWELARQPIATNQGSQIVFRNGINLIAQPERLNFLEVIGTKELTEVQSPEIARQYAQRLPNVEYLAVGNNFKGYIKSAELDGEAAIQDYIQKTLLAPRPWQNLGTEPVKTSLQLAFTLEQGLFNLRIEEGKLNVTEQETIPVVLFSGNFGYPIEGDNSETRIQSLDKLLDNWKKDIETFQEIIKSNIIQ